MAKLKQVRALKSSGVEPLAPALIKRIQRGLVIAPPASLSGRACRANQRGHVDTSSFATVPSPGRISQGPLFGGGGAPGYAGGGPRLAALDESRDSRG
jgi:hypothetical protein